MSSMAPVYRGEDFDKQIYTVHITAVYTPVHRHQQMGCEKDLWKVQRTAFKFANLMMRVAGLGTTVALLLS